MNETAKCRVLAACAAALMAATAAVSAAGPAVAAAGSAQRPVGAAAPVPASGIGTKAALNDPRCTTGAQYGPYGRWSTSTIGSGPVCVAPYDAEKGNGGATARGVSKDAVKVVVVVPSGSHETTLGNNSGPRSRANNTQTHKWGDMVHDWLSANVPFYETWGRDIDVTMYDSTGFDEAAQRADALAIADLKPFAVVSFDTFGLNVLANQLAQKKIVVNTYGLRQQELESRSPYLWGGTAANAAAVNAAEVIGKQLAGKNAEFGGDDVAGTTRKFAIVKVTDLVDEDLFAETAKRYGGKAAVMSLTLDYDGLGDAFGDPAAAAQQAPTMVGQMKAAGITTVVLASDVSMTKALMEQAEQQAWHPEWFLAGTGYSDLPQLALSYPDAQAEHAFGLSIVSPYFKAPAELATFTGSSGVYNWFWGPGVGTTSGGLADGPLTWLLTAVHAAGPDLTAAHVKQGLFSLPPTGGADNGNPLAAYNGYGRTTGLPYDAYTPGPTDYSVFFMDPYTTSLAPGVDREIAHTNWFLSDGRRYSAGTWPKRLAWFDQTQAIKQFDGYPAPELPKAAPACAAGACPASGAPQPTPGAPGTSFVIAATGATRA